MRLLGFLAYGALVPVLALTACSDSSSSASSNPDQTNLELAFGRLRHGGDFMAFEVSELLQGNGDLNGDLDAADDVLFVHDLVTGATTNLGLALRDFQVAGRRVVFTVSEVRQGGVDLNGDLDGTDHVLHVLEVDTGAVTNLGLACLDGFELEGDVVAFQVPEAGQGVDLNGDGDALDDVLHLLELASGVVTNLSLALEGLAFLDAGSVACVVSEAEQNATDLNGDLDATDYVLHVISPGAGTQNLGLAVSVILAGSIVELEFEHGIVAASVREPDQGGLDLDGDGNVDDNVLHTYELATDTTTNLGFATLPGTYAVGDGFVAVHVNESLNGNVDLNLDGDFADSVLQVHDIPSNITTNTRLAVFRFTLADDLVFAEVLESDQGNTDLTGDGDALDVALLLYYPATNLIQNPTFAGENPRRIGDELLAFEVQEVFQGGQDLNGDGDTLDRVLFLYDLVTTVTTNLEISGRIVAADDTRLAFMEFEEAEDLNGDGDLADPVLGFLSTATGRFSSAGLAGTASGPLTMPFGLEGGVLPFGADEFQNGDTDQNADGDAFDPSVLVLVEPKP